MNMNDHYRQRSKTETRGNICIIGKFGGVRVAFQACSLNHSDTSPYLTNYQIDNIHFPAGGGSAFGGQACSLNHSDTSPYQKSGKVDRSRRLGNLKPKI
jgi:hypothetical protein